MIRFHHDDRPDRLSVDIYSAEEVRPYFFRAVQLASDRREMMMAKDSDDTKPTIEDVDRVIREHERKDVARQDIKKATEERIAKGQEASQDVHFKKGESLWDRAARAIDAAEKSKGAKGGTEK